MPSTNKARAVFDNGKTSSYHIKSIADCQQSAKTSSIFKLILNRTAGNKRYDFEAESPRLAGALSIFSNFFFLLLRNDVGLDAYTCSSLGCSGDSAGDKEPQGGARSFWNRQQVAEESTGGLSLFCFLDILSAYPPLFVFLL
jgi:hypothetical protein